MTIPKKMSPEELAEFGRWAGNPNSPRGARVRQLLDHIAALEQERDAALADNAALVEQVRRTRQEGKYTSDGWWSASEDADALFAVVAQPHPGAALLEGHRKSLVRAGNAGLEKAREAVRAALTTGLLTPGQVRHVMREIDALREPVPCCERDRDGDGNCDRHPRSGS